MRAPFLNVYSIRGRDIVVRVEQFIAEALWLRVSFVVEFAARYVHSTRNALGFRILRSYSNSLSAVEGSRCPRTRTVLLQAPGSAEG